MSGMIDTYKAWMELELVERPRKDDMATATREGATQEVGEAAVKGRPPGGTHTAGRDEAGGLR